MTQPPIGGAHPSGPHSGGDPTRPFTPGPGTPPGAVPPPGPAGPHAPGSAFPPPAGYPPYQQPAAPRKKRGLLIASIVLALTLVLCGGGGAAAFLVLRNAESGEGAPEPTVAVDQFLTAVYRERDADRATELVCSASRDRKKIAAKVAEVEKYASAHQNPRFKWSTPKLENQTGERATVSAKVTMTTADEKVADQELRFTVVQKTGWWVCEVA